MKPYKKHAGKDAQKHNHTKHKKQKSVDPSPIHQPKRDSDSFETKITTWIGSRASLIVHTIVFAGAFALIALGASADRVLLILTTIVSLEAIYLAIFIQMSVNKNTASLEEVEEDIEGIQEGVDEITEEIEELQEDVGEITEEIDSIQEDVNEISEDIDEISEDIDEIQEDIHGEIESNDNEEKSRISQHHATHQKLIELQDTLRSIMKEIDTLKQHK